MYGDLASGHRFAVAIDPTDPYLRFVEQADTNTVDQPRWRHRFRSACAIVDRLYLRKATAMAHSISCLVPVAAEDAGFGLSATSAFAAGAVALTEPSSALGLAATLVHEHQHLKLNALHDLLPLFVESDRRYYSPWRNDPRPVAGLLHGAYAFLGVGDFWLRTCRTPSTGAHRGPHLEVARIGRQIDIACDALAGSPDLTDVGVELLTHLTRQAERWRTHDPPADIARVAGDVVTEHQVRWRLHHLAAPAAEIRALATARTGPDTGRWSPAPAPDPAPTAYGTEAPLAAAATRWAAGERLTSIIDRLVLDGRYAVAQSLLIGRVRAGATQQDWITLAVVARHTELGRWCTPLRTHPEVAYALHRELRRRGLPGDLATVARAMSNYVAGTSMSLSARR